MDRTEQQTAPNQTATPQATQPATLQRRVDLRLAVSEDVVGDYPIKIKCREHNDKVGSLAVYRDHIHCYGCGFGEGRGNALYALAYLLRLDLASAVEQAPKYTVESLDSYRERAAEESRRDPMPGSLATIYHEVLRGRRQYRLTWLYDRGISDRTIDDHLLGHDGVRFVLPVFDQRGNLVSLRFRRDDLYAEESSPKYMGTKGRNGFYVYPEAHIAAQQPEALALCEGELDALRLWQEGIPAISATNGAGQAPKVVAYVREHFPSVTHLIIATDMDEPGREAARLAATAATKLGFTGDILEWENGDGSAKDVSEALKVGALRADVLRRHLAGRRGGA